MDKTMAGTGFCSCSRLTFFLCEVGFVKKAVEDPEESWYTNIKEILREGEYGKV